MTVNGNLFWPSYASRSPAAPFGRGLGTKTGPDGPWHCARLVQGRTVTAGTGMDNSREVTARPMEVPFDCAPCPEPGSPLCLAEWVPLRSAYRRYSIRPLKLRVTSRPTKCPQVPECGGSFKIGKRPSRAWCDGCDSKTVPILSSSWTLMLSMAYPFENIHGVSGRSGGSSGLKPWWAHQVGWDVPPAGSP